MSYGDTIVIVILIGVFITASIIAAVGISTSVIKSSPYESDFTAIPHYVKFHIYPEEPNLHVALWASDKLPPTTGVTNNESEFTLALLSTVKYNMWIPDRKCSRYITPTESEYYIECGVKK